MAFDFAIRSTMYIKIMSKCQRLAPYVNACMRKMRTVLYCHNPMIKNDISPLKSDAE